MNEFDKVKASMEAHMEGATKPVMPKKKTRRHHNNKWLTQAKRGKLKKQARRLAAIFCRKVSK